MKKCIAILAVTLFVVSMGPAFAQQTQQTSPTDRPALEDQRIPKTDPAKTTNKPGAMTPERQKSDSDNPMAGEQTRPDKKTMKKSDKSKKSQGQKPATKTTDGPAAEGQYTQPVPEKK